MKKNDFSTYLNKMRENDFAAVSIDELKNAFPKDQTTIAQLEPHLAMIKSLLANKGISV